MQMLKNKKKLNYIGSSLSKIDQIQEGSHLLLLRHKDGAVGEGQTARRGHEPLLPGGGALFERVGERVEPGVDLRDDVPLPVVGRHLHLENGLSLLGGSGLPRGRKHLIRISKSAASFEAFIL
jgi:hypothetical protein